MKATGRTCREAGCDVKVKAQGYCSRHYDRLRRSGAIKPLTLTDRFWERVDPASPDECWPWKGYLNADGYPAAIWVDGRAQLGHRVSHELFIGPIPEGFEVDHLCRNRACVNPAHLEAVTKRVNSLRSESFAAKFARRTHCNNGHEFTPENTTIRPGGHGRACRTCRRAWVANRKASA